MLNYIVEVKRPIIIYEKPAFYRLIQGLTKIIDTTLLPNHKNISKMLQLKHENYVSMLTDLTEKQKYICCTASSRQHFIKIFWK